MQSTKQPKYRAACDHCAGNKVKCSQEKPLCQRCKNLGLQCRYSRSMRAGKPPRALAKSSKPRNTTHVPTTHLGDESPWHTTGSSITSEVSSSCGQGRNISNNKSTSWLQATDFSADSLSDLGSVELEPSLANPPLVVTAHNTNGTYIDFDNESFFSNMMMDFEEVPPSCKGHLPLGQESQLQSSIDDSDLHSTRMRSNLRTLRTTPLELPDDNSHDCAKLAMETLNSLYAISSHQRQGFAPSPDIDQVLRSNKAALKSVQILLTYNCATTNDFCFPVIMSTILSKILAWYQALVCVQDPHTRLPSGFCCTSEKVTHRPIAVGSYELDEKTGQLMKIQLVIKELLDLGRTMELFREKFCGHECNSDDNFDGGGHLYVLLGQLFNKRLEFTMRELKKSMALYRHDFGET